MNIGAQQEMKSIVLDAAGIAELNEKYRSLSIEQRITELYNDFSLDRVMLTSSFAATSAVLLHIFGKYAPQQTVYFIDTGFHFSETLTYKTELSKLFNLTVQDIKAEAYKHQFTVDDKTYEKDPDFCCSINKVEPLFELKKKFDVWVSGLMSWQSDHRATLDIFEERNGIIKFYPLIDMTKEGRERFIKEHALPFHPLVDKGYSSIGCKHCTVPGDDRAGRWNNSPKTECGLHL